MWRDLVVGFDKLATETSSEFVSETGRNLCSCVCHSGLGRRFDGNLRSDASGTRDLCSKSLEGFCYVGACLYVCLLTHLLLGPNFISCVSDCPWYFTFFRAK